MRKSLALGLALLACGAPAPAGELPPVLRGLGLNEAPRAAREHPDWRRPQKVLVRNLYGADVAALRAAAPGAELVLADSRERAIREIADADVYIGTCEAAVLAAARRLRWVQTYFAGVENCVGQPLFRSGAVVLSNGQRLSSTAIADHAIALTLALVRGVDRFHGLQARREWRRDAVPALRDSGEVSGRTMLVVGLGGIGTQVAKRAHGLGMRVLATRGSRREGPQYIDYVGLAGESLELARRADVVVNAAPLTDSTRGMFDAEFFRAMRPSAYFISVGRGRSTVTAELVAALKAGDIAGAGLDVTDPEPLPGDHELWGLPRVIITPHVAAISERSRARVLALVGENLRRYHSGEPLLSVVDIQRGY